MRLTIWKDVPVKIKIKCMHIHKIGKKLHNDFCLTYGDIPIGEITNTNIVEPTINNRGKAYAARKRLKYRKGYNRVKQNKWRNKE